MSQEILPGGRRPLTVADRVREKRAAERKEKLLNAEPIIPTVTTTTTQIRARLNVEPDDSALAALVNQALTALARGVRWARGSIINLIV